MNHATSPKAISSTKETIPIGIILKFFRYLPKKKRKETNFWFIGITAVHVYVKYYWKKNRKSRQHGINCTKCCTFIMSYCCQPDITSYILNKYCKISWKTKNVLGVLSWTYHSIARFIQIKSKNQDHRLPRHERLYILVLQYRVPELSHFK